MRQFVTRLCGFFRKAALDRQLEQELQFHLDMEAEQNRGRGMTEEDAASAARRAFGGLAQIKEIYREQRGLQMLETLLKDLQYGFRMIRRSPGFTTIAVLSLALGIGANTAIFTLIDAVMLRSLPVQAPQELVSVGDAARPGGLSNGSTPRVDLFSYPMYQRLRAQNRVFNGLMASGRSGRVDANIGDSGSELVRARLVSGNYFEVLGVPALVGRTFTSDEDRTPGARPVVVISFDYWKTRFAGDPAIPGRALRLNGAVFKIIGIGPPDFTGEVVGAATDVFIPLSMQAQVNPGDPRLADRNASWLLLMGRLKPGMSLAGARAEMTTLVRQALIDYAGAISAERRRDMQMETVEVEAGGKGFSGLRQRVSQPLVTLMIVVGLVLLIACGNVANLLLARATSRQKEISVRLAVGASRSRVIRQLLTESALLSAMGGAAGLLLALWGSDILLRLASNTADPIPLNVRPNGLVLLFTAAISILTGMVFGLVPAIRSTRVELAPALKENSRSLSGSGLQLSKLLVIGQVALSLLLLVGAGLFIRSLVNLETLDVGYSRANLVLLRADPGASGYPAAQQLPMVARLVERLRSVPGVLGATVSENGIFSGTESSTDELRFEGFNSTRKEDLSSRFDAVGPHYFQVVGVPLLAGREFDERDKVGTAGVVILNDAMARFYFGNHSPIGKSMSNGDDHYTIVGVVKDMKARDLRGNAERRFYVPLYEEKDRIDSFNFEIRTRGDAARMLLEIRQAVQSFDRNLKVLSLEPVSLLIDRSISEERLIAQLCGFFGVLALLLAATGLYGVMAYATSRRTNEIGLRMALGAGRREVIGMVVRETLLLVALGIAIGLPATLAATRLVGARLVGLSANDPPTIAVATVLMLIVAAIAGFGPAQRASRIDPMEALRQE
jgi:predicted permease